MNYFSDIEFVCWGSPKHADSRLKDRVFDYYGLQFIRSGEICVSCEDGTSWQASGPVLFLTGPGKTFTYYTPNGTREHLFACFRGDRVRRYIDSGLMTLPVGKKIPITAEKEFFSIMEQLVRNLRKQSRTSFGEAVLLLEKALLFAANQPPERKVDAFNLKIIHELAEEIAEHPEKQWDIAAFAASHELSEIHFRRLFCQKIGTPPNRYILNQRIRYAAHLLQTTDMLIKEIAFECGFGGEFYFSRQFSKIMKQSPSEFRKTS